MRRCAFLLAMLLLSMALLASCGETVNPGSSVDESPSEVVESADPSEDSSQKADESKPEESKGELVPISERVQHKTAVSVGCPYTVNVAADQKYVDSYNSELTDGVYGECESYSDGRTAGFAIGDAAALTLVIDLGKEYDNLYEFAVSYLHTSEAGIAPPSSKKMMSFSAL